MKHLYHGSNVAIEQIDLLRSKRGKDFGQGFYLNANPDQAMEIATRTTRFLNEVTPTLSCFEFDEDEDMLAAYHAKLFTALWRAIDNISLPFTGLNLDTVWENIVSSVGDFSVEEDNSLSEQIKIDEERAKLERQITALERQMNATKQPCRKRELFVELQKLKGNLI